MARRPTGWASARGCRRGWSGRSARLRQNWCGVGCRLDAAGADLRRGGDRGTSVAARFGAWGDRALAATGSRAEYDDASSSDRPRANRKLDRSRLGEPACRLPAEPCGKRRLCASGMRGETRDDRVHDRWLIRRGSSAGWLATPARWSTTAEGADKKGPPSFPRWCGRAARVIGALQRCRLSRPNVVVPIHRASGLRDAIDNRRRFRVRRHKALEIAPAQNEQSAIG